MADNTIQTGADTIRDKDRAGVKTQIVGIDLGIGTATESLMSGSMPVTGTFWQATQPVSLATAPTTPVTGTFWQATQPVSLATNTPTIAAGTNQIGTIGEFRAATLLVSATGAPTVAATCTLPAAGAGLFHYITSLTAELYSTAARTGGASPIIVTSTNLPGTPGWTLPSAGAIGVVDRVSMPLTTPLRSAVANTATVITGPATTSGSWRINVAYFVAA